jgi:hypothetical protein
MADDRGLARGRRVRRTRNGPVHVDADTTAARRAGEHDSGSDGQRGNDKDAGDDESAARPHRPAA